MKWQKQKSQQSIMKTKEDTVIAGLQQNWQIEEFL